MALASAVLYQAFRKIGQLRPGYTAPPELLADGLIEWANFFDECGAERNTHFSNPYYQHTITGPGLANTRQRLFDWPHGDDCCCHGHDSRGRCERLEPAASGFNPWGESRADERRAADLHPHDSVKPGRLDGTLGPTDSGYQHRHGILV